MVLLIGVSIVDRKRRFPRDAHYSGILFILVKRVNIPDGTISVPVHEEVGTVVRGVGLVHHTARLRSLPSVRITVDVGPYHPSSGNRGV